MWLCGLVVNWLIGYVVWLVM